MSYVLYGDKGSGSAVIELALAEIGAAVELRDVSLEKNGQRDAAYADVNPQRKIPALMTPDGQLLTESAALLLTLSDRHPEAGLMPTQPTDRATALRWLLFMAAELYPVIEIIDYPKRFHPDGDSMTAADAQALQEHARNLWKSRWRIVEDAASGATWFLSGGFSVVDIYAAVLSRWGQTGGWRESNLPRIEQLAVQVSERRRLDQVWQRHFGDQVICK